MTQNGEIVIRPDNGDDNVTKWWRRRSRKQRTLVAVLAGCLATIVASLAVYFAVFFEGNVTCKTQECYAIAADLRHYIDERNSPCNNFYRFACGTYLKNDSFIDPVKIHSVQLTMQEQIATDIRNLLEEGQSVTEMAATNVTKTFYKACINEQAVDRVGLEPLVRVLNAMGGWPLLKPRDSWTGDTFTWTDALVILRAAGADFQMFFKVAVDVDKDQNYVLSIRDTFAEPSNTTTNSRKAFLNYMVSVANQFDVTNDYLRRELNEVLDFMLQLAKFSDNYQNRSFVHGQTYTLWDLNSQLGAIRWNGLVKGLLTGFHLPGIVESESSIYDSKFDFSKLKIVLEEPLYIERLILFLNHANKRVLANFMGWHTVQSLINYLPSRILNKAYDYLDKVNGQVYRPPRWSVCVEAAKEIMAGAINIKYIERHFDDELKGRVIDLIGKLKHQFRKKLLMMDWMDGNTKRRIMHMLMSSVVKIFYDMEAIELIQENEEIYKYVMIRPDKLLEAFLTLNKQKFTKYYSRLSQPFKDDWLSNPSFTTGIKIVYSPSENILRFPLGLFRGLYYNKNRPDYMNYGLLGSVVAHQFPHIFMEAEGNTIEKYKASQEKLLNWWTTASVAKHLDRLTCLQEQYARLQTNVTRDLRADPAITSTEDMADLVGLKVAYESYLEKQWSYGREAYLPGLKYNERQLFWISSALQFCSKHPMLYLKDKYSKNRYYHSPNELRVNGPLQNIAEFASDFRCPSESYMNPVNKCESW